MAKWNWGGEENQGVGRNPDGSGSSSLRSPEPAGAVSSHSGDDPLRDTWNHRVYLEIVDGEEWFTIREAFYGSDKETPHSWTEDGVAPCGNTLDELRAELERMLRACDRPVLRDSDGPRMAETNEDSAPGVAGPARAVRHRPENPAYFWLGIQAEGRE